MPFQIDNFRADTPIIINDGTVDTTSTSIGLIGKGAEVYGETINENFLHILESFASFDPAGPPNPKLGQFWFHLDADGTPSSGNHVLKLCRSESPIEWITIASVAFDFPITDGNAGDVLTTDGSGTLAFLPPATEVFEDLSPVLAADLDANSNKIINLGNPTADGDAANKLYVDTEILSIDLIAVAAGEFVEIAGGDPGAAMTGLIFNLDGNDIETQLLAAGKLVTDKTYLPTRGMIEGAFLQGFPFPTVTPVSQKYDEQTLFDATQSEAQLVDGAVISWDVTGAQVAHLDLNSSNDPGILLAPSNIQDGGTYVLIVKQDSTGGRHIDFNGSYIWGNGGPPTISTAPNAVSVFTFVSDGAFMYGAVQQNVNTGFKNILINGNFDIWQRGTSSTTTNAYIADRWVHNFGTGGSGTTSRQQFTLGQTDVPGEPQYYLRFVETVGSISTEAPTIDQRIEDIRTLANETVTMSFWARVVSGSISITPVLIYDFGTGGSPSANLSQPGLVRTITTSWQKFTQTFVVNSLSGKILGTNNDHFLGFRLALPTESTYTIDVARCQLEKGSAATEFERRPIATELAMAQRYFFKTYNDDISPGTVSQKGMVNFIADAITQALGRLSFPTIMRVTPTVIIYNPVTGATGSARMQEADLAVAVSGTLGQTGMNDVLGVTVVGQGVSFQITADAEL